MDEVLAFLATIEQGGQAKPVANGVLRAAG
jgi:hypothetical protein